MKRLVAFIDQIGHSGDADDKSDLVSARLLVVGSWAFGVLGVFLNAVIFLVVDDLPAMTVAIQIGANVLVFLPPLILWTTRSVAAGGWFLVLGLWAAFVSIILLDGAMNSPALPFFLLLPCFAGLVVGFRSCAMLSSLMIATYLGIYVAEKSSLQLPVQPSILVRDEILLINYSFIVLAFLVLVHAFMRLFHSSVDGLNEARRDAEKASTAKAAVMATVSHEIRTPLNGLLGMASLLQNSELTADQRENVDVINESAEALLTIIDDILDLSKLDAGHVSFEELAFDLHSVIRSAVRFVRVKIDEKSLSYIEEIGPDVPHDLIGDPGRLRQVLVNLIGNAIKFTDQGSITVRVCLDQVSEEGDDTKWIRFEVEDTGIGVSPENLKTLFDEFQQADTSVKRRFGGTGLGLAISRRIVEARGGSIGVDAEPGRGSRFWFVVPCQMAPRNVSKVRRTAKRVQPLAPVTKIRPLSISVLAVDDNEINRKVVSSLLETFVDDVEVVCSGAEAIEAVSKKDYSLILMDIQMPEMSGIEAADRIRALDPKYAKVPIVALTANAFESDRRRYLDSGFDEYVSKPIEINDLFGVIEKCTAEQSGDEPASDRDLDSLAQLVLRA